MRGKHTLNELIKIKVNIIESLIKRQLSPEEIRFVLKKAVETSEEAYDATIKNDNQLLANLMARYADKKGVDILNLFSQLGFSTEVDDELEE
jgi:uncharacterized protein affecting Mg2+/Co2+ transport